MFKQRVVFVHGDGSVGAAAWPKQHGMALDYDALFLRRHGVDAVAEPLESNFAADAAIVLASLADDGRGEAGGELRLSGVNKRVETMLTMTGAHNFLKMFPDEAGALQSFGS